MRRVLVIDDDELSREVLGLLLTEEGYAVDAAASGEAALERLSGDGARPEVVLMDMQMPGLCGEELARRLRAAVDRPVRLIAMSGNLTRVGDADAVDGFLQKPFSMEEFAELLEGGAEGGAEAVEPATSEGGGDEVLDGKIFRGFQTMVAEEPLHELYRMCVSDAARQLTAMQEAAAAGDDAGLRRCAHAIKGSLGMVGARELQEMCSRIEAGSRFDNNSTTLAEFPAALERLRDMLVAHGIELT